MTAIRTKSEFYRQWHAGSLGNRPRTWRTADELRASGWPNPVVIRSACTPGWKTVYGAPVEQALRIAPPGATFNQLLDDSRILLQGEAMRGERGIELTYSTVTKPMKVALAEESRQATGLTARAILDHFLCPSSRDDLEALWDLYPDAVIEFGVYSRNLGDQPHRNTLIWEVRNY
jgi:hypothetical protein